MNWSKVKKINSNLSLPLDYLVHLQDVKVNRYDSYVFDIYSIKKELAINTIELYDMFDTYSTVGIREMLETRLWREVIASHNSLGDILRKLTWQCGDENDIIPNGNIDYMLSKFSKKIYSYLDKRDLDGIIYYANCKLQGNEVGKWINETYGLNSSKIASCNTLSDLLKSDDVELVLSNIHICYILSIFNYTIDVSNIPKIEETIRISSIIPEVVEYICDNDYLLNIALLDKDVIKNIFESIDNIKIIMSKELIVDKIKNSKEILTLIFETCPNFITNFILKHDLGYYEGIFNELSYRVTSNVNNVKLVIENSDNDYIENNLISTSNYYDYVNNSNNFKSEINIAYTIIFNSISLLDSEYIYDAIIKSSSASRYLDYDILKNLVINDGLIYKLKADLSLLEALVKIDKSIIGNELYNYGKYSVLLDMEGAKKTLQSGSIFSYLVKNELWLSKLIVNQEDYRFILDTNKLTSAIWNSAVAMEKMTGSIEHMNYLTHCTKESMDYFKGSSKIYNNSMGSAKMLMGLSGQDSSNINNLNDITLEQFRIILSNTISRSYVGQSSNYKISQFLSREDIYNNLKLDKGLLEDFIKINTTIFANELVNSQKYSELLNLEGTKRMLQSSQEVFSTLIKNELWLNRLMSTQEDYKIVLDTNKFRNAVWSSTMAMDRMTGSIEHMNYLTHCTRDSMSYFKDSSKIYNNSMGSAKMLIGLSGQDSSNINNLDDITIEQFKGILSDTTSISYLGQYSNYKLSQLLNRGYIYDYLFVNKEGYIHLSKIASTSSYSRSYILGNNEFAFRICNNPDLFKEVIKINYYNISSESKFIENFRQSDIACIAFWDMAKDSSYTQISNILSNQTIIDKILDSPDYFIKRLIDVMDYLPRSIYKVLYSNKSMFKHIYSNANILCKFLKHDIASDVLITECNVYLQNNVSDIMSTVNTNSNYDYGTSERVFNKFKEYTAWGESLFYKDIYSNKNVIFFVQAGVTNSDYGKISVYHGHKTVNYNSKVKYLASSYGKYYDTNKYTVTYGGVFCNGTSYGKCVILGFELL